MIIEFAGIPTSGKSTMAARLRSELDQLGVGTRAAERARGVRGLSAVGRAWVPLVTGTCGLVAAPRTHQDRLFFVRRLVHASRVWPAGRHGDDVVILEESFRQRAMSLFTRGDQDDRLVRLYSGRCPRPDVLVLLRLDPTAFEDRHAARSHALSDHLRLKTGAERVKALTVAAAAIEKAAGPLVNDPQVVVWALDAGDLDECWTRLRAKIRDYVSVRS